MSPTSGPDDPFEPLPELRELRLSVRMFGAPPWELSDLAPEDWDGVGYREMSKTKEIANWDGPDEVRFYALVGSPLVILQPGLETHQIATLLECGVFMPGAPVLAWPDLYQVPPEKPKSKLVLPGDI